MIPDQVLQQIAAANDIVETIASYVSLKKGGKDFKALCPFHSEKTPSFSVSQIKQIFHCFGCGAGGDVIGFVMKMEKMEFPEAVELLAQKKGIDIARYHAAGGQFPSDGIGKKRLYEINTAAKEFFKSNLKEHTEPQDYLKKRGVSGITARDFSMGWALAGWDGLLRWALQNGFTKKELLSAGLVIQNEQETGKLHDRFRARVIFPVFDAQDRVIAFSGRVLDDALPKYINSPETSVFTKGATLFGLNMAKEAIVETGWVAVCEGPMDMIGVYQAGIKNIVASQGTAFTQRHAKLIKRFASRVVLCFDGDQAGQSASLRSLDAFLAEGMEVKIAVLPPKEDPDSFVRARGKDALMTLFTGAMDFLDFKLKRLQKAHDIKSDIGKANMAKEVLNDLAKLPSAMYQSSCIQKLSETLGVREETLWLEFKKLQTPVSSMPSQSATRKVVAPSWEMDWVAAVVQNEPLLEQEAGEGHFEMLSDTLLAGIVRTAVGQWKMSTFRGIASVSILFGGREEAEVLAQLGSRPMEEKDAREVYEEGLAMFHKRNLETRIKQLMSQIESLERDNADVTAVLTEVSRTKKELMSLQHEVLRR